jgi:ferrochelatase
MIPRSSRCRSRCARLLSGRRAATARAIYDKIGGGSPLLANTLAQATALTSALGSEHRSFVAMRYWHPYAAEAAEAVKVWNPDRIVLLPLYPQFSTTTTASSFADWHGAAARAGLAGVPTVSLCCYPDEAGFIAAEVAAIRAAIVLVPPGAPYRILFSAHGLPKKIVAGGDPYQWQVERTVAALRASLGIAGLDSVVCYQSRVGPLEWLGPATDAEIRRAGAEGIGLVVVPVAFVSEHSETLVELDIEYRHLADHAGIKFYHRAATVDAAPDFIGGLANLVRGADAGPPGLRCPAGARLCPAQFGRCPIPGVTNSAA